MDFNKTKFSKASSSQERNLDTAKGLHWKKQWPQESELPECVDAMSWLKLEFWQFCESWASSVLRNSINLPFQIKCHAGIFQIKFIANSHTSDRVDADNNGNEAFDMGDKTSSTQ